jgi:chromosome partitioning protein
MGARAYLEYINSSKGTIVDIFEQFSAAKPINRSPTLLNPNDVFHRLQEWDDGSFLDLVPSRLELAWTLKNPTEKAHLLPSFITKISNNYDIIIIDCAPTESILTTVAYLSSRYIFVPVKPEFLATIGLPLLARSLDDFRSMHQDNKIEMGGIIFNDKRRSNRPPEQMESCDDVCNLANSSNWHVFENEAYHSDSYPTGSRDGTPIFLTDYARDYVKDEFRLVANEFLKAVDLK